MYNEMLQWMAFSHSLVLSHIISLLFKSPDHLKGATVIRVMIGTKCNTAPFTDQ